MKNTSIKTSTNHSCSYKYKQYNLLNTFLLDTERNVRIKKYVYDHEKSNNLKVHS